MSILQSGPVAQDDPYGAVAGRPLSRLACMAVLTAALLGSMLLMWGSPQRALASCEGPCTAEQKASGLAHPPSWAAEGQFHFEPENAAASAYSPSALEGGEEYIGPVEWQGGPVQLTPKIYVIFWGSNVEEPGVGKEDHEMLEKLFNGYSGSAYEGIWTQYFDASGNISSTVTPTFYVDKSVKAPEKVNRLKLEEEVTRAVEANKWTPEVTAQFIVTTAPGTTWESTSGCAYHGKTTTSEHVKGGIVFDNVPYQGDKPFSENGCIEEGNPSKNPVRKTS
ncbi:MAG: hypothetical protein ACLP7W_12355, partial [Solirubrobacteraceae bacterium]